MENDNTSAKRAKNKRAARYHTSSDMIHGDRNSAELQADKNIAKTPMCVMRRDKRRRFFIYLSRQHIRVRARAFTFARCIG